MFGWCGGERAKTYFVYVVKSVELKFSGMIFPFCLLLNLIWFSFS